MQRQTSGLSSRLRAKLRHKRGETLVEALCAILIVALSSLLLAGGINAASRINFQVRNADTEFRDQLTVAETHVAADGSPAETAAATLTLTGLGDSPVSVNVTRYGDPAQNQLLSYLYTPPEGGDTP